MKKTKHSLESWVQDRNLTMDQIKSRYEFLPEHIQMAVSYGSESDLTEIHNQHIHPAYFYFTGDKLFLMYVEEEQALGGIDFKDLEQEYGEADLELRCRAGKQVVQMVYLKQGITVATDFEELHFVEVFLPCSSEYYLQHIYDNPSPFTK